MAGEGLVRQLEDAGVAAEFVWQVDDGGEDHDVEHDVLDDGNDGGGSETRRPGVGGEDDERGGQGPLAVDAEGGDDDADAYELQGDIRHECEDAGERDG